MLYSGTGQKSYITEYALVYEEKPFQTEGVSTFNSEFRCGVVSSPEMSEPSVKRSDFRSRTRKAFSEQKGGFESRTKKLFRIQESFHALLGPRFLFGTCKQVVREGPAQSFPRSLRP